MMMNQKMRHQMQDRQHDLDEITKELSDLVSDVREVLIDINIPTMRDIYIRLCNVAEAVKQLDRVAE